MIRDDTVITKDFNVPWYWTDDGFGINPVIEYADMKGGGRIMCWRQLRIMNMILKSCIFPTLTIDREKSLQIMECAQDVFGDILNCRFSMKWHWDDSFSEPVCGELRGMEDFYV